MKASPMQSNNQRKTSFRVSASAKQFSKYAMASLPGLSLV